MDEISTANPQSKARTSQACLRCRRLKARCLLSDQQGVCQKCSKLEKPCIFAEQQPRQRRGKGRQSNLRVTKIESKLDGLLALLGQGPAQADQALVPLHESDREIGPEWSQISSVLPDPSAGLAENFDELESAMFEPGALRLPTEEWCYQQADCDIPQDLVAGGLLSSGRAEQLLSSFRDMMSYFPFVIIRQGESVESMSRDRPFLFLAAVTAASSQEKSLQQALNKEVLHVISQRIIFDGDKSIDLLQGLLVYLAWYHFHYIPGRQKFYQFLQIAIGMVIDLGLNQTPREAKAQKVGLQLSHCTGGSIQSSSDNFYNTETRRAYLGCFFLSTCTNLGFPKPNNLKYTDYMNQCALSLQQEMEVPTDDLLPCLIRLNHLTEDINTTYHMESSDDQNELIQARLKTHLQNFQLQFQDWKNSLPNNAQQYPLLTTSYHCVNVAIHEIGLVVQALDTPWAHPSTASSRSIFSLNTLFTCLSATKSYFSSFLLLPSSIYKHLPLFEWSRLIQIIFILYRLSTRAPVPGWDFQTARETVRLEDYLEPLRSHLWSATSPTDEIGVEQRDLYSRLGSICENVRVTYLRIKERPFQSSDEAMPHQSFSAEQGQARAAPRSTFAGCCPFLYSTDKTSERRVGNGRVDLLGETIRNEVVLEENQGLWNGPIVGGGPGLDVDFLGFQQQQP